MKVTRKPKEIGFVLSYGGANYNVLVKMLHAPLVSIQSEQYFLSIPLVALTKIVEESEQAGKEMDR
jgi:hypothetical protein